MVVMNNRLQIYEKRPVGGIQDFLGLLPVSGNHFISVSPGQDY